MSHDTESQTTEVPPGADPSREGPEKIGGAVLSVLNHPGEREECFELPATEGTTLLLGRGPGADIDLDDTRVSRAHAQIAARDGRHFIQDLGSVAGTGINGSPAQGSVELRDGDRVQVGATNLLYSTRGQAPPAGRASEPGDADPDETVTVFDSGGSLPPATPPQQSAESDRYRKALAAVIGLIGLILAWMLLDPK